jgi:PGF-CTERM protein
VAPPVLATQPDTVPNNQTFTTNNVEVWEESIFTLRHDFEDAPTSAKTGDFRAGIGSQDASLNREFVGVRTAGDEVTLTYDAARVQNSSADIDQSDVQLIAARVTGSGEPVTTFSEAIDLISQENANTNATFEQVAANVSLSGGEASFDHIGDAGHYVYFAVDRDSGTFSVTDGDISIGTGTPLVIGVEQITFQRGSPESVSAPAIAEPGDDLSFDIDTSNQFDTDNITHTVLVYDESKFSDINQGEFRVQVSDRSAIDENFDLSEDAVLFHEINEVNGIAEVDDGIEVNGIDISDGRVSRAVSLGSVVDFVAEDIEGNPPQTTATDSEGTVQLDASVTADAQQDREDSVTVETFGNWTPGSYRYVYIGALESNASAVATSTGTVSIESGVDVVAQGSNSVADDGSSPVTLTDESVSAVSFSGLKSGTTASVARVSSPPSTVSVEPDSDTAPTYLEINAEPQTPGGTATVQTTVNKSQFNNPDNAQVYRYNGSAFVPLSTTVVDETSSVVTLEFTTGFSLFAVGESSGSSGGGSTTPSTGGGGGGGGGLSTGFTVSDLDPEDVEVTQGDEITVTATITTDSYLEETQDVAFQLDGDTVASQEITLSSQESTTVEFTGIDTSDLEGEYEHGIVTEDDSETGTLTVTVPADAEDDTAADEPADDEAEADEETEQQEETAATEETEDGTPGFGPLVALVAIIAAALLATRRNRQQ